MPDIGEDGATSIDSLFLCGDGTGIRGAAAAELHGALAGLSAAEYLGAETAKERNILRPRFNRAVRFGLAMTALNIPRPGLAMLTTPDTIVCRCESLTQTRISQEVQVVPPVPMRSNLVCVQEWDLVVANTVKRPSRA